SCPTHHRGWAGVQPSRKSDRVDRVHGAPIRSPRLASGGQIVVDLLGAQRPRAREEPSDIALESRPLLDRAELHAEANMGPNVDIRGRKTVAEQILALRDGAFESVHRRLESAVADHPF